MDVVEDSDISITCDSYVNQRQCVVYNDRKETIFNGSCIDWNCTPWNDKFYLRTIDSDYSRVYYKYTLTMYRVTRNSARFFSCSDSLTYAQCDFRIIGKQYTHYSVDYDPSNFVTHSEKLFTTL